MFANKSMMKTLSYFNFMMLMFLLLAPGTRAITIQENIHFLVVTNIENEKKSGLKIMALAPTQIIKAAVVLFSGGRGILKFRRQSPISSKNFLIRSRQSFANKGYLTVIVGAPTIKSKRGIIGYRTTNDYAIHIREVLRWIRKRTNRPIFLVGTSRGSIAVAALASRLSVAGVVFSASVTRKSYRNRPTIFDAELSNIISPTLLMHHVDDQCIVAPTTGVTMLEKTLTSASSLQKVLIKGGHSGDGRICGGLSYHGYLGVEDVAVSTISNWIDKQLAQNKTK